GLIVQLISAGATIAAAGRCAHAEWRSCSHPRVWPWCGPDAKASGLLASASEFPHHLLLEAVDDAAARERDQSHLTRLPRLEAHRGPGGNVEPHAARGGTVEAQGLVGLEEVVVRADLDRPVAGIGDF